MLKSESTEKTFRDIDHVPSHSMLWLCFSAFVLCFFVLINRTHKITKEKSALKMAFGLRQSSTSFCKSLKIRVTVRVISKNYSCEQWFRGPSTLWCAILWWCGTWSILFDFIMDTFILGDNLDIFMICLCKCIINQQSKGVLKIMIYVSRSWPFQYSCPS